MKGFNLDCFCENVSGLPRGWLCGKPECPRTKEAEKNLRHIYETLIKDAPDDTAQS